MHEGSAREALWSPRLRRADYPLMLLVWLALCGLMRLAAARLALAAITPAAVLSRNAAAASLASDLAPERAVRECDRVAFFIPRVARRLPWRSDCLVQALAGQAWLASAGIASEIRFGVGKPHADAFEAHAWLIAQGHVLLGGDVTRFHPLIAPQGAMSGHDPRRQKRLG